MKKTNLLFRITLFGLIFTFGVVMALIAGETAGLALADLSNVSVGAMTEAAYGDTLYAAINGDTQPGGIYRSDNNGRSWLKVSNGPEVAINALAVHPANEQVIYAGTNGGDVFSGGSVWYSDNQGKNWDQYRLSLPANADRQLPTVNALSVDPYHPGVLYVGTDGQGMYRFRTGHDGYELMGGLTLRNLYVKNIVPTANGLVYSLTTDGLFVMNGDIWHKIESLPDLAVSLAVDPTNPDTLYVGTTASGIYQSLDSGKTWQAINTGLDLKPGVILRVSAVAVDSDNPDHLALATAYQVGSHLAGGDVYESVDVGRNWIKLGPTDNVVKDLTIKEGGVYGGSANALIRYGKPLPTPWLSNVYPQSLSNPTAFQALILIITIALAGWALIGRLTWIRLTSEDVK